MNAKTIFTIIRESAYCGYAEDFEPTPDGLAPTNAMPGSESKVAELAARVAAGLPLWHPQDRLHYDDGDDRDRGNGIPQRPLAASTGPALPRVQTGMRRGEWNQSRA